MPSIIYSSIFELKGLFVLLSLLFAVVMKACIHLFRPDVGVVVVVEAWRLELTRRLPQNSAWLLYSKGIISLPTARNSNEVAGAR